MKEITDNQASYVAGLVDGEGCISLTRYQKKQHYSPVYVPIVTVTNTFRPLMDYLQGLTGIGTIGLKNRATTKHKESWRWDLKKEDIKDFLIRISPFLFVKREQSKILLEYLDAYTRHHRDRPITPKEQALSDILYDELRALNARGPGDGLQQSWGRSSPQS